MRHALAASEGTRESVEQFLDNIQGGVVQLDRRGRVIGTNDRGQSILNANEGVSDDDGHLRSTLPEDMTALQGVIDAALPQGGKQRTSGSIQLKRPGGGAPTVLHVVPIGKGDGGFRSPHIAAVVLVASPEPQKHARSEEIAAALDLTRTESIIATAVATGKRVSDIARDMGRAENTVRWHMKHIFAKLGVARQIDVARVVTNIGEVTKTARKGEWNGAEREQAADRLQQRPSA